MLDVPEDPETGSFFRLLAGAGSAGGVAVR